MKFMAIVWATFLARVRPDSTSAKPACMNMTRNPVTRVHTMLSAACESASCLARSAAFIRAHRPPPNVSVRYLVRCDRAISARDPSERGAAPVGFGERLQPAAGRGTEIVPLERIVCEIETAPVRIVLGGEKLLRSVHGAPVLEGAREDAA